MSPWTIGQLFGAAGGGVRGVDLVEAGIVYLIEALLQGEDWGEPVTPQHLRVQVGAASLAGHPCGEDESRRAEA